MKRTHWTATVLAAAAIGAAPVLEGCSTTQSPKTQTQDVWITSKVKTKLTADPEINPFNIDVDTHDGVVYLTGTVPTRDDAEEAIKHARETEGVKDVVSHLKVKEEEEQQETEGSAFD